MVESARSPRAFSRNTTHAQLLLHEVQRWLSMWLFDLPPDSVVHLNAILDDARERERGRIKEVRVA